MDWLVDPLTAPYLQRSFAMLVVLSLPAGPLGVLVLLRGNVFTSHALGNGAFPGTVAAVTLGVDAFVGALAAALTMALLIGAAQRRTGIDAAVATALSLVGALALGSWLVSQLVAVDRSVDSILFGSLFGVTGTGLQRGVVVALVALVTVAVCGRGWIASAFDPAYARALGVRGGLLEVVFLVVLATTVVSLVAVVGSLLVSTLLVVPAATARLLVGRVVPSMLTASVVALGVSTCGLLGAYWLDAPPGGAIAALATAVFLVVLGVLRVAAMTSLRRPAAALGAVALVVLTAGCGGSGARDAGTLRIVATTPQVADWARRVGGDRASVTEIVPPNVDPHEFEPSSSAAGAVADASLVLASGAGLDGWVAGLIASAGGGADLVEVAPRASMQEADQSGGLDPHFWHDPRLVVEAVGTIEAALARADPEGAAAYARNAKAYAMRLDALDAELTRRYGSVPRPRRRIVTDHDAFGYLARRYGLTIVGTVVPSLSTAAEPAAKELAALVDTIERERVCVVLAERSVDPRLSDQVARETGATVEDDLYGDSLGLPGSGAGTYVAMMEHNARVIVAALGCERQ